jgi:hypothetical protein
MVLASRLIVLKIVYLKTKIVNKQATGLQGF